MLVVGCEFMLCLIAFFMFGILSIFSVRYRPLTKESFECIFRRLTLRKCTTGLDKRLKAQIIGKIMPRAPKFAGFLYKYFEVFSLLFVILLVLSLVQSGISVYNLIVYNNCNGDSGGYCVLNTIPVTTSTCGDPKCNGNCNDTCNATCNCVNGTCSDNAL